MPYLYLKFKNNSAQRAEQGLWYAKQLWSSELSAIIWPLCCLLKAWHDALGKTKGMIGVGTVKIEIILKALAWSVLVLTVLLTMGLGSGNSAQPPRLTWYPDGHLVVSDGDPTSIEQRYLNESQLMQLVAFDDNVIPKKALTSSAIPSNLSYGGLIHDNESSNNESLNNVSLNITNSNNTSPLWWRWLKTS